MDQCSSNALKGFLFCGKHLKMKHKRLWSDVSPNRNEATNIQRIWKGHFVRRWIKLAGAGCLKRGDCHNDEELVTMESKTKVDPFSYFSIVEANKIYWFDICSINQWIKTSSTNPYTRQNLILEDRRRLREICRMRRKLQIGNLHKIDHSISSKWIDICQIIEENGFFDMNHLFFQSLTRSHLHDFLVILMKDLVALASGKSVTSRYHLYIEWIKLRIENFNRYKFTTLDLSEKVANTILVILYDCVNNFDICYAIVSTRYKL
jgi:hypothetical protein